MNVLLRASGDPARQRNGAQALLLTALLLTALLLTAAHLQLTPACALWPAAVAVGRRPGLVQAVPVCGRPRISRISGNVTAQAAVKRPNALR